LHFVQNLEVGELIFVVTFHIVHVHCHVHVSPHTFGCVSVGASSFVCESCTVIYSFVYACQGPAVVYDCVPGSVRPDITSVKVLAIQLVMTTRNVFLDSLSTPQNTCCHVLWDPLSYLCVLNLLLSTFTILFGPVIVANISAVEYHRQLFAVFCSQAVLRGAFKF